MRNVRRVVFKICPVTRKSQHLSSLICPRGKGGGRVGYSNPSVTHYVWRHASIPNVSWEQIGCIYITRMVEHCLTDRLRLHPMTQSIRPQACGTFIPILEGGLPSPNFLPFHCSQTTTARIGRLNKFDHRYLKKIDWKFVLNPCAKRHPSWDSGLVSLHTCNFPGLRTK